MHIDILYIIIIFIMYYLYPFILFLEGWESYRLHILCLLHFMFLPMCMPFLSFYE